MPRKLKVYQTSQGFYDLAIAAPSMKAAVEAWGANMNLFHQGFAKESNDRKAIAAAMDKPGIVLRRPVGTDKAFHEHADLPTAASLDVAPRGRKAAPPNKATAAKPRKVDEKAERRSAAAFEKQQRRRESQRQKEEAAAAKVIARRKAAMAQAEAALADARRDHEEAAAALEEDLAAAQRRAEAEKERWEKLKQRLETNLRKASR